MTFFIRWLWTNPTGEPKIESYTGLYLAQTLNLVASWLFTFNPINFDLRIRQRQLILKNQKKHIFLNPCGRLKLHSI